jgi:small subunit ribosomal protein S16
MPRDGRFIEVIGHYDPKREPSLVEIDAEKARSWLAKGAQPTQAVARLLKIVGIGKKPEVTAEKAEKKPVAKKAVAKKAVVKKPAATRKPRQNKAKAS